MIQYLLDYTRNGGSLCACSEFPLLVQEEYSYKDWIHPRWENVNQTRYNRFLGLIQVDVCQNVLKLSLHYLLITSSYNTWREWFNANVGVIPNTVTGNNNRVIKIMTI